MPRPGSRSVARACASTLAAGVVALAAAPSAQSFNYVSAANGDRWGVNDVAAPKLDTGSIRSTDSNALTGYGGLRVRVSGAPPLFNGELMRGFGLRFDGLDHFRTTKAVDLGGVAIERDLKIKRTSTYARFLDTFTNTTSRMIRVEAMFGGRLGSGGGTSQTAVVRTSSGDTVIGPDDTWATVGSPTGGPGSASRNGPSATVIGSPAPFSNRLTRVGNFLHNSFTADLAAPGTHEANFYGYEHEFVLLPGQTKSVLHYVVIGVSEDRAFNGVPAPGAGTQVDAVSALAGTLATTPDLEGLSTAQICSLENFDPAALGFGSFDPGDCASVAPIEPDPIPRAAPKVTSSPYDVVHKTASQLVADMEAGVTTSQEITRAYLDRIAAYDTGQFAFNAFTTVASDAMEQARKADELRKAGHTGDLLGVPVAVKDLYDTKDMQTTNGSLVFEGWRPLRDSFQVAKLREAGAVIIGKASLEEYAQSGQYSDSAYGQVWNGFNPSKSPLASSGGTGTAIATSMAPIGMGSQTGDSLYAPSAAASLFTLRGTDGMASGAGVMPLVFWQDYGGAMARSPEDLARIQNATTGTDPEDEITVEADADNKRPADWKTALDPDALKGKKIGWYASAWTSPFDEQGYVDAMKAQWQYLVEAGAEIVEIDAPASFSSAPYGSFGDRGYEGWQRYIERHPNLEYRDAGEIINSQLRLPYRRREGAYSGSGPMTQDQLNAYKQYRKDYKAHLGAWMDAAGVDAVLYPGLISDITLNDSSASAFGRRDTPSGGSGVPTINLPAGRSPNGDPIALQLLGRAFDDAKLLGFAYAFDLKAKGTVNSDVAPRLPYDASYAPKPIEPEPPVDPEPEQPKPGDKPPHHPHPPHPGPGPTPDPPASGGGTKVTKIEIKLTIKLSSFGLIKGGKVTLTIKNTSTRTARGRIVLQGPAKVKGKRRTVTFGRSGRATLKPGQSRKVTIKLGPTARKALKGRTRMKVKASTTLTSGGGKGTVVRSVVLKK